MLNIMITYFCNVMSCSFVAASSASCTLYMEAVGSSKTFVPIYETAWHHMPYDHNHITKDFFLIAKSHFETSSRLRGLKEALN